MPFVSEKLKKCTNDLKIHYNFHDRNYTIFYFDVFYWHGKSLYIRITKAFAVLLHAINL